MGRLTMAIRGADPNGKGCAPVLNRVEDYFVATFEAMASPCSVLVDTDDHKEAEALLAVAEAEARRIEQKFSRYRRDNLVYGINHSEGRPIDVDEETALLINYAVTCYEMSDGCLLYTSDAADE